MLGTAPTSSRGPTVTLLLPGLSWLLKDEREKYGKTFRTHILNIFCFQIHSYRHCTKLCLLYLTYFHFFSYFINKVKLMFFFFCLHACLFSTISESRNFLLKTIWPSTFQSPSVIPCPTYLYATVYSENCTGLYHVDEESLYYEQYQQGDGASLWGLWQVQWNRNPG